MPNGQPNFDGQNPVAGYTLFQGKDGQSYYLKGEGLSDAEVAQRVATLRAGSQQSAPDTRQPLSKVLGNMTAAMSGQPQTTPGGQENFDAGRAAGMKSAALTAATEGLGSALAAPTVATKTIGTGILDEWGQEFMRKATQYGPSAVRQAFSHPLAQDALKAAAGAVGGPWIMKRFGLLDKTGVAGK
jgi:hypothetical protein